jgi:hypothetical protein
MLRRLKQAAIRCFLGVGVTNCHRSACFWRG